MSPMWPCRLRSRVIAGRTWKSYLQSYMYMTLSFLQFCLCLQLNSMGDWWLTASFAPIHGMGGGWQCSYILYVGTCIHISTYIWAHIFKDSSYFYKNKIVFFVYTSPHMPLLYWLYITKKYIYFLENKSRYMLILNNLIIMLE